MSVPLPVPVLIGTDTLMNTHTSMYELTLLSV